MAPSACQLVLSDGVGEATAAQLESSDSDAPAVGGRWRRVTIAGGAATLAALSVGAFALHKAVGVWHNRNGGVLTDPSSAVAAWSFSRSSTVCGWNMCDCRWATGGVDGSCALRAKDQSTCWSCCCQSYFRDDYDRLTDDRRGYDQGGVSGYHDRAYDQDNRDSDSRWGDAEAIEPGEEVDVEVRPQEWHQGRVLGFAGEDRLRVRFEGGRIRTVPVDHVLRRYTWWQYILSTLFFVCLCSLCVGAVGACVQKSRASRNNNWFQKDLDEELRLFGQEEEKPQRSCGGGGCFGGGTD